MKIEDCIYFWSFSRSGENSEIVDAPSETDGCEYYEEGYLDDNPDGGFTMRTRWIKNPVHTHSGSIFLVKPLMSYRITDENSREYRVDVRSDKKEIDDEIKQEIILAMKKNIIRDIELSLTESVAD